MLCWHEVAEASRGTFDFEYPALFLPFCSRSSAVSEQYRPEVVRRCGYACERGRIIAGLEVCKCGGNIRFHFVLVVVVQVLRISRVHGVSPITSRD